MSWLPQHVERVLANPVPAGAGHHQWLPKAVNHLRWHVTPLEAEQILLPISIACGRSAHEAQIEIRNTIKKLYAERGNVPAGGFAPSGAPIYRADKPWPERDQRAIDALIQSGPGVYDLWEQSPVRFEDDKPHTEEIIDAMFPSDAWLCVGRHAKEFRTEPRRSLRGELHKCSHIVPSPMDDCRGRTQAGHHSAKCNDSVEYRRFIVTEFDSEERDSQAAIIWHLRQFGRLVIVVDSRGKSLHAWWYCQGSDESKGSTMHKFFSYAVKLGADRAGWTLSQFMRMPDGTREKGDNKGQRQTVIYFNPEGVSK